MERDFAKCGLTTAEELIALGADASYGRLISAGIRPHFIAYCALAMGLEGRDWQDPSAAEKVDLRRRFDAIKAEQTQVPMGIEAELDRIGTGRR